MNTITKSNQLAKDLCKDSVCRYVYGAKYQKHTTSLVNKLAKQYPGVYTDAYKKKTLNDADKGYYGIDCSGFVCKVLGVAQQGSSQIKSRAFISLKVTKTNAQEGMAIWKQGHIAYVGEGLKIYEANGVDKDMEVSSWDKRAKDFTHLLVVKGSYLAEHWKVSSVSAGATKRAYLGTFPKGTLKKGSKGTQVKNLQKFLNWYGNYGLAIDGSFGTKTYEAVKKFQKATGLTVDGIFGSKSLAKAKSIKK